MYDRRPPGIVLDNSRWNTSEGEDSPYPPPASIKENSIPHLFFAQAAELGAKCFARFPSTNDNSWNVVTWKEAAYQVATLAAFLKNRVGIKHGDRIAILSGTRLEWVIADLAILSLGAVSVPIYQTLSSAEAGFILADSQVKIVFAENEEQVEKLRALERKPVSLPSVEEFTGGLFQLSLRQVITFEQADETHFGARQIAYSRLFGETISQKLRNDTLAQIAGIKRSDVASIVYTSGTTGVFKGVIQTHGNHLAMLDSILLSGLIGTGEGLFLYLPLAHSFARVIVYLVIAAGGDVIFPKVIDKKSTKFDAKQLFADVKASHPVLFPTVPRIFEKIMTSLTAEPRNAKDRLIQWAIRTYRELSPYRDRGNLTSPLSKTKLKLAERVVGKVRSGIFGRNFRYAVSGGAPLSPEVNRFFDSIGITIYQGYGLTETTPATNANTREFNKIGTVGRVFPGIEMRIAEDGEIEFRGPNNAVGYLNQPKATAEAWKKDGWFCTGDIGEIDEEGFLRITDRKKELIVNAGGKKIAPALLEGRAKTLPYVSQCLVFGDQRPYLVALVTLEPTTALSWAASNQLGTFTDLNALVENEKVAEVVLKDLEQLFRDLGNYEQVRRVKILAEDFTIEAGLLSPTLKMKRKAIVARYQKEIDSLYLSR